jgi:peptidoglycan/LPS O-acetylase OafA/YrhL
VWFATTPYGRLLCIAPLRFLGRISYPLYLVHQAAGFAAIDKLEAAGVEPNVAILATIGATIVLAWLISSAIEWPAQRWLRARFVAYGDRFRENLQSRTHVDVRRYRASSSVAERTRS